MIKSPDSEIPLFKRTFSLFGSEVDITKNILIFNELVSISFCTSELHQQKKACLSFLKAGFETIKNTYYASKGIFLNPPLFENIIAPIITTRHNTPVMNEPKEVWPGFW